MPTPRLVVVDPEAITSLSKLTDGRNTTVFTLDQDGLGSLVDAAGPHPAGFDTCRVRPDDTAVILYTSGTTGWPKGAMLTHQNIASNAVTLNQAWGWRRDDVLTHALPIFHLHGLFVTCHCVMMGGSRMFFLPRFEVALVMRFLPRSTVFMGVPTLYTRLLDEPKFGQETCNTIRLFISGSAPLLPQTFEEFEHRTGHRILERYGMTETCISTSNLLEGECRPGTVGLPLPGVEVRVVDSEDRPLAPGQVGYLQHRGPNVLKGYWRNPQKTTEAFTTDGFFRSGDLGKIDDRGYLSIVGRTKDLIITGGLKVYPFEVESYLDQVDGVAESAVIGLPHHDFGEVVTAAVVPEGGEKLPYEDEIIALMKERIASFKVPKRIFFLPKLPRNVIGKVQKELLRERFAGEQVP